MSVRLRVRSYFPEESCLTFGYLQILATIACAVELIWEACSEWRSPSWSNFSIRRALAVRMVPLTLMLAFAVVLVVGVHKRKEGNLLAYFIMGVVTEVGMVIGGVLLVVFQTDSLITYIVFGTTVMYALCLRMVYDAYRNILLEKSVPYGKLLEDGAKPDLDL